MKNVWIIHLECVENASGHVNVPAEVAFCGMMTFDAVGLDDGFLFGTLTGLAVVVDLTGLAVAVDLTGLAVVVYLTGLAVVVNLTGLVVFEIATGLDVVETFPNVVGLCDGFWIPLLTGLLLGLHFDEVGALVVPLGLVGRTDETCDSV